MESLNELKNTLKYSKEIDGIIHSMKSTATLNVKIYEKIADNLDSCRSNIEISLQGIINSKEIDLDTISYLNKNKKKQKILHIIFGSNQGLCGRFNDKVLDFALSDIDNSVINNFLIVGDRLSMFAESKNIVFDTMSMPNSNGMIVNSVFNILNKIEELKPDATYLYYMNVNESRKLRLNPIDAILLTKLKEKKWVTNKIPQWRLDTETLILNLLKQYIFILVNNVLVNSLVAEHRNRLVTLQGAKSNIEEIIKTKTTAYNQRRQLKITQDLLDIIRIN
ncbi:MAG: F0F1 ATP synthase subunit gamma [Rickettsiales bacterium]|jgi:F-type H+-transporting ATPase subunit gamma|nr:F0F1 ATP synthase subunit gamma [Rickettsiales bacterium]